MNRVTYVPAYFKELGRHVQVKVPTGEMEKGFLGGSKPMIREEMRWEKTGVSDCEIDGHRLAKDIEQEINALNDIGYELVTLQPTISGCYFHGLESGYGYSVTEGVTIISKKCPS